MELFGGSGVGKLCPRRRLKRGAEFDLVAGFDLTTYENQRVVIKHVEIYKPLVIVVGPPCAAFGR